MSAQCGHNFVEMAGAVVDCKDDGWVEQMARLPLLGRLIDVEERSMRWRLSEGPEEEQTRAIPEKERLSQQAWSHWQEELK